LPAIAATAESGFLVIADLRSRDPPAAVFGSPQDLFDELA
jgi:hypothetical protein